MSPAASPRLTVFAGAVVTLGLLLAFWPTVASVEAIWRRSQTFTHGYLVVPIVLWLIWRARGRLAARPAAPLWPALGIVALAGFAWMLGRLAGVVSVEQFALYAMVVGALLAVLGASLGRELAFPLAFLAFAVPFGEFLVPVLMDRTADATVAALRLSGVPVYREGNHFMIPTGRWSVVEACSGIRYLTAAVMIGTLYAYLSYRTARRRLVFILASIAVPIVANWARAYLIVMLGHLTSNRLAAGVDHVIYGWFFFGVVLAIMFWVGSYWREEAVSADPPPAFGAAQGQRASAVLLAMLAALAIGIAWRPLTAAASAYTGPAAGPLPAIVAAAGWRDSPAVSPSWRPHYAGAGSERHQWFAKDGQTVGVYLALYSQQGQGSELIVSDNQLVKADDPSWKKLSEGRVSMRWNNEDVAARDVEISGEGLRLSARTWYWVDGRHTASDAWAKAWLARAKLLHQPDHSALIVIYAVQPEGSAGDAAVLDDFARDMGMATMQALRQASAGGA